MLPIRLNANRFPGGFQVAADRPGILVAALPFETRAADRPFEPLIIDKPDLENPLFLRLANCRDDAALIKFADRFYGEPEVELAYLRGLADYLRKVATLTLDAKGGDPRYVHALLEDVNIKPRVHRVDGVSRLVLETCTIQDFMAVEVAAALEADAHATACARCAKLFLFGSLTRRRSHAKFCSTTCRVAALRARNANANAEKEPSK